LETASVVVIGAGAAGLVAAAFASTPDRPALLLERTADGGRKILISGGGRCNVLPAAHEPERFVTSSPPHLVRRMLRAWPLAHQKRFFEETLGIPLKFEEDGRKYFPRSDRARDIRDGLVRHARAAGVDLRFGTTVRGIAPDAGGSWRVQTSAGALTARAVVVATGGLSVPSTGSDGTGLDVAAALGHVMHPSYPALTPLLCEPARHAALSGVSLTARLRVRRHGRNTREATGGFLFTHRGYSGPAVLDVSSFAREPGAEVRVAWSALSPDEWTQTLTAGTGFVSTTVGRMIPQRLADALVAEAGVPSERRVPDLRRDERIRLVGLLTAYPLPVTGDEGYRKAEVTGGGVALDEVDPATLESRRAPGLFFCGEVLDAWGPIGGHNFSWAFATGHSVGQSLRK
jgi:predicted Rossmann fold flavoprotein